jgi:hypothetical protein
MEARPSGLVFNSGVDGTRTREENTHETTEIQPDRGSDGPTDSPALATTPVAISGQTQWAPASFATSLRTEPSEAEIEAAIVRAVGAGAFEVATALSKRLEGRRHEHVGSLHILRPRTRRSV